jgi:hypothetical protein
VNSCDPQVIDRHLEVVVLFWRSRAVTSPGDAANPGHGEFCQELGVDVFVAAAHEGRERQCRSASSVLS